MDWRRHSTSSLNLAGETKDPTEYRFRSTIPPDPGYGEDHLPKNEWRPAPHLHGSAALANYRRATAPTTAPYLQHPRYLPLSPVWTAGRPKNQLNENVRRMRRIMRASQKRRAANEPPRPVSAKELWQSSHYDHVESKVKERLDKDEEKRRSRPHSAEGNFLQAHENTGPKYLRSQSVCGSCSKPLVVPTNLTTTQSNGQVKPDFVKVNSRYVKTLPKTRPAASVEAVNEYYEKQDRDLQRYQRQQQGFVPKYVEKRNEKRKQEAYERCINAPDAECPPGHQKIPEAQREATLKQLEFNRTQLLKKLNHLPVRNDTVKIRQTKADIETRLADLDEAIQIFSKPKVFLKQNE